MRESIQTRWFFILQISLPRLSASHIVLKRGKCLPRSFSFVPQSLVFSYSLLESCKTYISKSRSITFAVISKLTREFTQPVNRLIVLFSSCSVDTFDGDRVSQTGTSITFLRSRISIKLQPSSYTCVKSSLLKTP